MGAEIGEAGGGSRRAQLAQKGIGWSWFGL